MKTNSLYGIETQEDCREKIDELLEMTRRAEKTMNKEDISVLKSCLEKYNREGNGQVGRGQMSRIESSYFWPAVREAYVKAPNLASPTTWLQSLYDIASSLRYYRPKEHIE